MSFNYKGFKINRDSFGFKVQKIGKGALPKVLYGTFTNEKTLKDIIDLYMEGKKN